MRDGTAAPLDAPVWATGAKLKQQLKNEITVSWSNLPLDSALQSLAASQHVATLLDRRVDPERRVSLRLPELPLAQALGEIAEKAQIGYSQFGPVAYFGPTRTARRLRTLAASRLEEVRPLGPVAARKFLLARSWQWDDLAEPRALVEALAKEAGVDIVGGQRVPHDLLRAADLPPLSWIDRLSLLAAQFDLEFHIERAGKQVELVPIDKEPTLVRTYTPGREAARLVRQWARVIPDADISLEGDRIRVKGRVEDHELVEARSRAKPIDRPTVTPGPEVYQLSVDNAPLSRVIEQLAARLEMEFRWDQAAIDAAGISIDQLVSVKVKDANLDELLRAVLKGTGLAFRRQEQHFEIFPADRRP